LDHFLYRDGHAFCEDVPLATLAEKVGTPAYVYTRATLRRHCREFRRAFAAHPTLPCFAVKANSNLAVLKDILAEGFGADLVSLGELERALAAGARPAELVFSGVGKRPDEIARALRVGLLSFNVESPAELELIATLAGEAGVVAPVALRLNPDIDAKTNEKIATGLYTTKFGLPEGDLPALATRIAQDKRLSLVGLACHIGSQILDIAPLAKAASRLAEQAQTLKTAGHRLSFVNMGGGLGIRYRDEKPPALDDYARALIGAVAPTGLRLLLEPGRVVAGNAGILLARVILVKRTPVRTFIILDAAMNDLIRPSLYDAWHAIEPESTKGTGAEAVCDFVGPVCETGDYLGKERRVKIPAAGDLFMIRGCGAYGASMASQYNTRPRAPEVLVDGDRWQIVRPRETLDDLLGPERAALAEGPLTS
jgi:diaminopimelate decarboxylase